MGLALGRIVSIVVVVGGWMLFGIRLTLDVIGYSTVPEDLEVAKTRLQQALDLLLSAPWWVVFGFALVATLWLMWVSWPRTQPAEASKTAESPSQLAAAPEDVADIKLDIQARRIEDNDPKYHFKSIIRFLAIVENTTILPIEDCRISIKVEGGPDFEIIETVLLAGRERREWFLYDFLAII